VPFSRTSVRSVKTYSDFVPVPVSLSMACPDSLELSACFAEDSKEGVPVRGDREAEAAELTLIQAANTQLSRVIVNALQTGKEAEVADPSRCNRGKQVKCRRFPLQSDTCVSFICS